MGADLVRVVVSLGVVLALLWVGARLLRRTSVVRSTTAIEVLARAQLARNTSLAIVRIADTALVLGVGDGRVSLVAETDLEAVRAATAAPVRESREPVTIGLRTPLAGSALSPATWRTALEQVRSRTVRRA